MTANVNIAEEIHTNVLRLPVEAIRREKRGEFVLVMENGERNGKLREVKVGLANEDFIEITDGLVENETVIIEKKKSSLPKKGSVGKNPFMPTGGRTR